MLTAVFSGPDRDLAEVAALQFGVFTRADASAAGLSREQIDRRVARSWVVVHEGVYRLNGVAQTWKGDLFAACRAASPPAGISRRAGAAFFGLPGGQHGLVEITCRRWKRTKAGGVVVHESTRLDQRDIVAIEGISVVRPERLVLELAGIYASPNFVEKVIQAARRKRLITYDSTVETFNRLARRGLPGVKATRIALERWDRLSRPTESDMETWLIQILREHGLPEPVTQFYVRDELGNLIGRADAALPEFKITFEYQSDQEHSNEFQIAKDDRRRNAIIAAGYFPLAARYGDLRDGGHVLVAEVKRLIRRAS
jgi:hypothetical protein